MVLFNKQRYEFFSKLQLGDYAAFEAGKKYVYSMRLTSESLPACVLPGQRIFPVGEAGASRIKVIFALMEHTQLLRAILPDVLIDNFDVVNFEKTASRFDIWLDEKKVQMREDKGRSSVISHGFGEYRTIRDFPIRGRSTYLHVRKRKWLDKDTGEIFSYDWELSEYDETHLNAEFVSFLKGGD